MQVEVLQDVYLFRRERALQFSPGLVNPGVGSGARALCRVLGGMKLLTLGPCFTGNEHPDCVGEHNTFSRGTDSDSQLHPGNRRSMHSGWEAKQSICVVV